VAATKEEQRTPDFAQRATPGRQNIECRMKDKEEEMTNPPPLKLWRSSVECPITNVEVKAAGRAPPYEEVKETVK
jgi:hypothetical protein